MSIVNVTQSPLRFSAASVINGIGYTFAILFSAALVYFAYDTLDTCFDTHGACGTPCMSSYLGLSIAPLLLTLPFIRLLWLKGLSVYGLVARCAVTCGLGVWAFTFVFLNSRGWFEF